MRSFTLAAALAGGALADKLVPPVSPPSYPSPWMDKDAEGWKEAYAKAKAIVELMTLPEKVNLTTGTGWLVGQCVGETGGVPRLGIPRLCMHDSPLGIRGTDYNTAFPSGQTTAATWDRKLFHRRGNDMGKEFRGKGIAVALGPVAGPIGRAPAAGRNWEGFSPDPYLTGIAMAETIEGIQEAGVIACAKHLIGNEQETFRLESSSNIDDKTMHELYLWPFADAVRAGVGSVMCSYNQINGSYACQNSKLLNGLLKEELGFQGFVMADWQAHHSGVSSAAAGLDQSMPGDTVFSSGVSYFGANLTLAVANGTLPQWRVDDMAMRFMAAYYKVGLDAKDRPEINFSMWNKATYGYLHASVNDGYQQINWHVDVRGDHHKTVREVAAKGTVILKNKGALPLRKPKFLAVVGEDAGGNPAGPNACPNRGCNIGTLAMGWGSGTSEFPYLVTPDAALQARALKDGSRYESVLSNKEWDAAQGLITQADVTAIVFVNADSGEEFITVQDNVGDRNNLELWNDGASLIKNVSALHNNTIVVIHSTGPVTLDFAVNNPNVSAIVWAGLPGQESGNSIVDVLYGETEPGRLPFTWGTTRQSYGVDIMTERNNGDGFPQIDFTEGVFIDYRHFDKAGIEPLYPFGHGLSYTTFKYSNLKVTKVDAPAYAPASTSKTAAAPLFGNHSTTLSDYAYPANVRKIQNWIYPWLDSTTSGLAAYGGRDYGDDAAKWLPPHALDGAAQPIPRAGGAPGGNPRLWDVLYEVTADVTNSGSRAGDEVPQLYVSLGGKDDPVRVLRGFDRLSLKAGETGTFKAQLRRRDLSRWDVAAQDWVVGSEEKKVFVGRDSRHLDLQATL